MSLNISIFFYLLFNKTLVILSYYDVLSSVNCISKANFNYTLYERLIRYPLYIIFEFSVPCRDFSLSIFVS